MATLALVVAVGAMQRLGVAGQRTVARTSCGRADSANALVIEVFHCWARGVEPPQLSRWFYSLLGVF